MGNERTCQASAYDLDLAENYQRHRDYIIHEDGLINNRVGWFIQLHSFLLATYGIVLASAVSTFFPQATPDPSVAQVVKSLLAAVLASITIIGICSAISAVRSITAAHSAIKNIQQRWVTKIPACERELFPGLIGGGNDQTDEKGATLHHFLPIAMIVMWAFSLGAPLAILWLTLC
ncbi:hypothetical protein [Novosphingobium sp. CECT 9465]|uniref:hypothetical protein n=1 Tax=Novosphingobium sp. CECT 9465 TaxID=2829794 RepID=UPI001E566870|nr:hypothetical protein [Novosphingobium sp. CECT 9465]